jgi:hypothetical protein
MFINLRKTHKSTKFRDKSKVMSTDTDFASKADYRFCYKHTSPRIKMTSESFVQPFRIVVTFCQIRTYVLSKTYIRFTRIVLMFYPKLPDVLGGCGHQSTERRPAQIVAITVRTIGRTMVRPYFASSRSQRFIIVARSSLFAIH